MNYSRILPLWQILFLFLFACFGIHKLFLFLFIQKLAPQIYPYSYLREKILFADGSDKLIIISNNFKVCECGIRVNCYSAVVDRVQRNKASTIIKTTFLCLVSLDYIFFFLCLPDFTTDCLFRILLIDTIFKKKDFIQFMKVHSIA